MEVFGHNHPVPFSKMLTFYRSSPFTLSASYSVTPSCYPQSYIGMDLILFTSLKILFLKEIFKIEYICILFTLILHFTQERLQ